jgi:hypothetical protein
MDLYRLGVKIAAEGADALPLDGFIPLFHRWIQQRTLDELLVDVADYGHVHHGPGILLVAHEGNYSFDESGGHRGLAYYLKRPVAAKIDERLALVCRRALHACRLIEEDAAFSGKVKFNGADLEIFANDRLLAPNSDATLKTLRPAIDALLSKLHPGAKFELTREPDPKERFSVRVAVSGSAPVAELLKRLEGK